jgi:nitroimidazol reductase NimA-like FMN-containing flavoprotein (pyridoxamine 5'-phosphate oxidase superfamily)
MTQNEKQAFLAALHVGVLGLNDPGRGPLTVPIWYDYEVGGHLWLITGSQSRKGKLLGDGTRISLAAQTEQAPYQYVSVEGPVVAVKPTDQPTLIAMAVRYLGEAQGQAYAAASNLEHQITVYMQPERWLAVDYNRR